nr:bis(5'-nucleosyl)-tetraphosphatase (symmetrical) [uncultured bacterium]
MGDIQGCYQPFMQLLETIQFNENTDTLWLTGDIVNRGTQSLEVLRFVKQLPARTRIVLGNHDIHLLAIMAGERQQHAGDTLTAILAAPDRDDLQEWLRQQPIMVSDKQLGYVMVHAGLFPFWDIAKAEMLAHEIETVLRGDDWRIQVKEMFGNEPSLWRDDLHGAERIRCCINYFTRMRYCTLEGKLDLSFKGPEAAPDSGLIPWFKIPGRKNSDMKIIFGHWASLMGHVEASHVYGLDTGCVWGEKLTAMRLEDGKLFCVGCKRE